MSLSHEQLSAEQRFRQAFERLKANRPNVLKSGTNVSQNNVAKEAGCDPSALRKSRFPTLIREIQAFVELRHVEKPSKYRQKIEIRKSKQSYTLRIEEIAAQRDQAQSQLLNARQALLDLLQENHLLKARLQESAQKETKNR